MVPEPVEGLNERYTHYFWDSPIFEVGMKKIIIIFLYSLFFSCIAENIDLKFVCEDNAVYIKSVAVDSKQLILVCNEFRLKKIIKVEGFEELKQLEDLCFYFYKFACDLDFLNSLENLRYLYLMSCEVQNFEFISELKKLERTELDLFINQNIESLADKKISLKELKNLKELTINVWFKDCGITHIPPFVDVKNRPVLKIDTTYINKLSKVDYKYAKQYSKVVSLNPNPKWPFN